MWRGSSDFTPNTAPQPTVMTPENLRKVKRLMTNTINSERSVAKRLQIFLRLVHISMSKFSLSYLHLSFSKPVVIQQQWVPQFFFNEIKY